MSEPGARLTVTPLGHGRFLIETDGRQRLAYGVRAGGASWIHLDGAITVVEPAAATRGRPGATDERGSLSAPMPATVVAIAVKPGQRVASGDVLIRLEAMKMELPIRAPRDATVIAVKCRESELVQPGIPLVELDET